MIGCYIIYTKLFDRYYIGATHEDPYSRLQKHNNGFYGPAATSYTSDWTLFLFIECTSYSQAMNIEKHIKRMKSSIYIINMEKYPEMVDKLREKYL